MGEVMMTMSGGGTKREEELLLGIDFGTGGCKISAVTPEGELRGEASIEYPTYHEHPGWSEQEPSDWFRAMCGALRILSEKGTDLSRVRAVAFDGSTHNAVLLDEGMNPVRRTIMWTDQRSVRECAFLKEKTSPSVFDTAWQMPAPTWTLPQLMWIAAHEPEIIRKTRHILFVKDYVRYLMTGVCATDRIEAQGTLFYDMAKQNWSEELFAFTGLSPETLPPLISPTDQTGRITPEAARLTGLPEGIPVICGSSDSAAEDYGAGAVEAGDCIVKLATAGNVNVMTSHPHPSERTLTYSHVIPGMWYTVSATNAAALCQRWFRDLFCETERKLAEESGKTVYELMNESAAESPPGANGVFFHPYLQGERSPYWDASLRGSFTGVSVFSRKSDFLRAVLEGVAFSLLDCYGSIREMKLPVKRIILIGGGARSALWSRIVCDVFRLPLRIPTPGDASFGAALLAGTGAGFFKDPREAVQRCLKVQRALEPEESAADRYAELFPVYRNIHDALAPVYAAAGEKTRDTGKDRKNTHPSL